MPRGGGVRSHQALPCASESEPQKGCRIDLCVCPSVRPPPYSVSLCAGPSRSCPSLTLSHLFHGSQLPPSQTPPSSRLPLIWSIYLSPQPWSSTPPPICPHLPWTSLSHLSRLSLPSFLSFVSFSPSFPPLPSPNSPACSYLLDAGQAKLPTQEGPRRKAGWQGSIRERD